MRRGFTLLETAFAGIVLMIGTATLIAVGRNLAGQAYQMRNEFGEPAIAQALIHEEITAIDAQPTAPVVPPAIAPLGLSDAGAAGPVPLYGVEATVTSRAQGLSCYAITATFDGLPVQAASPSSVIRGEWYAPAVLVCRN